MKLSEINNSVETLGGIGPATTKQFARLNIFTISDLLQTFPRSYDDRTKTVTLNKYAAGLGKVHTICKVTSHAWFGYGRMKTLKLAITDGTANAWLIAFNRPFLEKALPEGSIVAVTGDFSVRYNELQSSSFEAERISYDGELSEYKDAAISNSGVIPVYPLTEGLSQKNFHKAISLALKQYGKAIDDELPATIIQERHLLKKSQALFLIHKPKSLSEATDARRTFIYEELYNFEYTMALRTFEHRGSLPTVTQAAVFDTPLKNDAKLSSEAQTSALQPQATVCQTNASSAQGANANLSQQKNTSSTQDKNTHAQQTNASVQQTDTSTFKDSLSPRQKQLLERLPFTLTDGQASVIKEMDTDIDKSAEECNLMLNKPQSLTRTPFSMQRLLQGDVGSGKTLVAFFVCLRVIDYGGQCALMAPTELLARQHAENAATLLEPLGVKAAFLTGNLKAAGRAPLLDALKSGDINIVIGTHALFSKNVMYKNLQLAVIDEQHRFGVTQRESIIAKGRISNGNFAHSPNLLMMSATPIPQTLALTAFGDLDVSSIHTMPLGRKQIQTYLSVEGHEMNVYKEVLKQLNEGHQAYFVYPRISEDSSGTSQDTAKINSKEDNFQPAEYESNQRNYEQSNTSKKETLKSAEEMYSYLQKNIFTKYKCALIHSKVDEEEQNKILEDFRLNKIQVLVATTVVEVGVDVPNATCIVIEHADRFGLAELHQLRGRVGRSSLQSYCFLLYSKNITQTGIERMKAIRQNSDGFVIAEEDLKLRGPGEVNGTAQSGDLSLNIADLVRDRDILTIARYDAFSRVKQEKNGLV